jgi:hypothetical protein
VHVQDAQARTLAVSHARLLQKWRRCTCERESLAPASPAEFLLHTGAAKVKVYTVDDELLSQDLENAAVTSLYGIMTKRTLMQEVVVRL